MGTQYVGSQRLGQYYICTDKKTRNWWNPPWESIRTQRMRTGENAEKSIIQLAI